MAASRRLESQSIRSILFWAVAGVLGIWVSTEIASSLLYLDRMKQGARTTVDHAVDVTARSASEFLRGSWEVLLQVTSRTRARDLLVDLNAGRIAEADFRRQTEYALGDALSRTSHLRGITRLDRQGRLVANVGESLSLGSWPNASAGDDAAFLVGPIDNGDGLRVALAAPILDRQARAIGTDVAVFSLEPLNALMASEMAHEQDGWSIEVFLSTRQGELRGLYEPSAAPGGSILATDAAAVAGSPEDRAGLTSQAEGVEYTDQYVYSVRKVDGAEWRIVGRRSTADLYADLYRDVALTWLFALLLVSGGVLVMLLLMRGGAKRLKEELAGLRTEVEAGEARYRELVRGSLQGVLIHRDLKPLLINEAWAKIHGLSVEEGMNLESIVSVISPKDSPMMLDYMKRREEDREAPTRYEYRAVHRSGKEIWVENVARRIIWEGKPAIQAMILDISERKDSEELSIKQREGLEVLVKQRTAELEDKSRSLEIALRTERDYASLIEQFVTMTSHEFRTPLTIIDMAAQHIDRKIDNMTPEAVRQRTDSVRKAVRRMTTLIESVLNSARISSGHAQIETERCDLAEIVAEACRRQQDVSPAHRIRADLSGLRAEVCADSQLLEQVFKAILSNAVKYSPESPQIAVLGQTKEGRMLVSVADQGIGIPAAETGKVFDRFVRASNAYNIPGTGIGLSLARQIVRMHGGDIEVESTEGRGSIFTVSLPVRSASECCGKMFEPNPTKAVA